MGTRTMASLSDANNRGRAPVSLNTRVTWEFFKEAERWGGYARVGGVVAAAPARRVSPWPARL